MADKKEINYTLLALLGGAVIGAGVALLFAPATGEETRENVGNWLSQNYKKSKEGLTHQKEQLSAAIRAGKEAYVNQREKVGA